MNNLKIEIKWGVILAIITFLVFFFSKILGWQTAETFNMHLSAAFGAFLLGNVSCLWLGLKEKRTNDLNGVMTYVEGLKSGVIITVVATVLGALSLFLFTSFINPDFLSEMTKFAIAGGNMEAGQMMNTSDFLTEFFTHSFGLGIVFSLIIAFVAKKGGK